MYLRRARIMQATSLQGKTIYKMGNKKTPSLRLADGTVSKLLRPETGDLDYVAMSTGWTFLTGDAHN